MSLKTGEIGYDLSKYQGREAVRPAFVILNMEDPDYGGKRQVAIGDGIPDAGYLWINPNENGASHVERALRLADKHGGMPPEGIYLDYEQGGVGPWQLDQCLAAIDSRGLLGQFGLYTYLYIIATVAAQWAAFIKKWLAYYPGSNNGALDMGRSGDAVRWGAHIWQFTSTGGTLDQNVIIMTPPGAPESTVDWDAIVAHFNALRVPRSEELIIDELLDNGRHQFWWIHNSKAVQVHPGMALKLIMGDGEFGRDAPKGLPKVNLHTLEFIALAKPAGLQLVPMA
jgi:hypothetical protein